MSAPTPSFVVTTSRTKAPAILSRAQALAERFSAPLVKRTGPLDTLMGDGEWAYVVSAEREEMVHQGGASFFVHAGLFGPKTQEGVRHPLIRAVAPSGHAKRIVDATLGLAGDALHLAFITGAQVVGAEASGVVSELLTAGLSHLQTQRDIRPVGVDVAAARISVYPGLAKTLLDTLEDDSVDVVYVDPMQPVPTSGAPGFDLFRAFARPDPFDAPFFRAALRVAPRVVVKTRGNQMASPHAALAFERIHRSRALAYWVLTKDAPTVSTSNR